MIYRIKSWWRRRQRLKTLDSVAVERREFEADRLLWEADEDLAKELGCNPRAKPVAQTSFNPYPERTPFGSLVQQMPRDRMAQMQQLAGNQMNQIHQAQLQHDIIYAQRQSGITSLIGFGRLW